MEEIVGMYKFIGYGILILYSLLGAFYTGKRFATKSKIFFEYGTIRNGAKARRNSVTGVVEMLLWKAGEQGYEKDFYHKVGDGWDKTFSTVREILNNK